MCSTITRWASANSSGKSELIKKKRNSLCGEADDKLMDGRARANVDTLGRFIKDADARSPMQPAAEDCLLLIARQTA